MLEMPEGVEVTDGNGIVPSSSTNRCSTAIGSAGTNLPQHACAEPTPQQRA